MSEKYLMNTIDGTYLRAREEGIGVSKNYIRNSVLNGSLPHKKAGSKRMINWDHFIRFINTPENNCNEQKIINIRPVPENLRKLK